MPMFDTEYEVEIDPDHMSWEAVDPNGSIIGFSPHICSAHRDLGEDHRGWIDMSTLQMTTMGILVPLAPVSMNLTQASIIIEGLTAVGSWAHLNQGLDDDH